MVFICSLVIPVYFLRLMADGRKIERRLAVLPVRSGEIAQVPKDEKPFMKLEKTGFSSELYS